LIKSNKKEIRALGARALGILASHPARDDDSVSNCSMTLRSMFANADGLVGSDANTAEGALLALGYLNPRSVYYDRAFPTDVEYPLKYVVDVNGSSSLHTAALEAFSQLWSARLALPSPDGDYSIKKVVTSLSSEAKKGNEKAIAALGRLAVGLVEPETDGADEKSEGRLAPGILGTIIEELFALHEIKQVEVQFTVGEALTAAMARWDSNAVKLTMDVEARGTQFRADAREDVVEAVLAKLLQNSKVTKPSLLKASGIWLFCAVQYCSHLTQVQSSLREIQASFMRLLSAEFRHC